MKCLLTGATGFVGRNFLLEVLRRGTYEAIFLPVRSVDKLREQLRGDGYETLPPGLRPIVASGPKWDLGELPELDHVIHMAGVLFARTRDEYFQTNVDGTLELLRRVPCGATKSRVLILSSQAASGPCADGVEAKGETEPDAPVTWYGESKLEMERRIATAFAELECLFLRPPMVLGPRDQATLPLFKMARQPVQFKPGLEPKWYSFIAVGDLVSAILKSLESPEPWRRLGQRHFFVAASEPISDRTLITTARDLQKRKGLLLPVPQGILRAAAQVVDRVPSFRNAVPHLTRDRSREIWPTRWVVSPRAFEQTFGWKAQESLGATLSATRDWYVRSGQLPA